MTQGSAQANKPNAWADIKPGDTITVKRMYRKRPYQMTIRMVEEIGSGRYAWVTGKRMTASGKPSNMATHIGLYPGERREFVHIGDVTDIRRASPLNAEPCGNP